MTSPTISPVSTMGVTVPYITIEELKRSPIFTQLRKLVPNSSDADRDAELGRIITRVSSMINSEVSQNLAATVDREVGEMVVTACGDLRIHCRSNPIIEVLSISTGVDPYSLAPIADLSQVILDPWRITVPRGGKQSWWPHQRLWVEWVYVNGYPVTTMTSAVSAGATSVTVKDATGIMANQTTLTVEDGKWLELITPTAVTGNVLTVPPLAFPHVAGTGVTTLPDDVKEATLILISRIHDNWALAMGAITHDGTGAKMPGAKVTRPMCAASEILKPYRRMW